MLFDGYFESLDARQGRDGCWPDRTLKGREIGRAVRIVEEGLKASLNLSAGGALAADLSELYAYVTLRLTQANLKNDAAALDECQRAGEALARGVAVDRIASRWPLGTTTLNIEAGHIIMNATHAMDTRLLGYYEALERASNDMLAAARAANWDQVVRLEGACVLLDRAAQARRHRTEPRRRGRQTEKPHHAAHPRQRRRDPHARRTLARRPRPDDDGSLAHACTKKP